jgi:hypothetical protein
MAKPKRLLPNAMTTIAMYARDISQSWHLLFVADEPLLYYVTAEERFHADQKVAEYDRFWVG